MTAQDTRIRRVSCNDFRIRELHARVFPNDVEPDWPDAQWWTAERGSQAIAFAGIQQSKRWRDAGYLVRAGVVPSARGQGLQRRLIRVREGYARRMGWRWIVTATLHNPASANSLIASGFRLYEPAHPWLADGALYWRKRVAP